MIAPRAPNPRQVPHDKSSPVRAQDIGPEHRRPALSVSAPASAASANPGATAGADCVATRARRLARRDTGHGQLPRAHIARLRPDRIGKHESGPRRAPLQGERSGRVFQTTRGRPPRRSSSRPPSAPHCRPSSTTRARPRRREGSIAVKRTRRAPRCASIERLAGGRKDVREAAHQAGEGGGGGV
jgi:hypothetical protein